MRLLGQKGEIAWNRKESSHDQDRFYLFLLRPLLPFLWRGTAANGAVRELGRVDIDIEARGIGDDFGKPFLGPIDAIFERAGAGEQGDDTRPVALLRPLVDMRHQRRRHARQVEVVADPAIVRVDGQPDQAGAVGVPGEADRFRPADFGPAVQGHGEPVRSGHGGRRSAGAKKRDEAESDGGDV